MSTKNIFRNLGVLLRLVSIVFLIPIPVAIVYKELVCLLVFIVCAGLIFLLGQILCKFVRAGEEPILTESLVTIVLLWIIVTLASTLPFILTQGFNFIDSWHETMSAWTTTGLSFFNPELLPKTLVFWRSLMAFVGGVGIVTLALGGIIRVGAIATARAEGFSQQIRPNIVNSIKMVWKIYLVFLIGGIIALMFAGMNLFEAVNHAATAISTAGFSTYNSGIAAFQSLPIEIILIVLMILGAISFQVHHLVLSGQFKRAWQSQQTKLLFLFLAGGIIILLPFFAFRQSLFQVVSALTTTGFNTVDISQWGDLGKVVLMVAMIIGGASGSTAGGIKLLRVLIVFKAIGWEIKKIFRPHLIIPQKIEGTTYHASEILTVLKFVMLFLSFLLISSFIFMAYGYPAVDSLFQVASAMGTTGLSVVSSYGPVLKLVIIFDMLLGRLEIWAILIFISFIFKRKEA